MAVINLAHIAVKPGRTTDQVELTKQAKKILERHGARNVRLLLPVAGPAPSETAILMYESDDLAAWGQQNQALFSDPAMVDIFFSCTAPAGPTQTFTNAVYMDAPLD